MDLHFEEIKNKKKEKSDNSRDLVFNGFDMNPLREGVKKNYLFC